mmetsp:Transcript_19987/g.27679  ORF Transcript_19987/g.27679 Transcript_19987/m.27679 type:complete len:477 (-) Transcript_19987:115-1545(-)|eukprot:CAMPEP_0196589782 /NCGR_PEP_ID=MMETSP1081-20130531/64596_1 /TAXON_ID=36882 /ORGANISM="Pyramimonas amylifera, Strain CCMP720" /LENGTH=476 /DNA_ID=CAMNT_0041912681 /DNA_START=105 /DNA_END=1535 /DNA_ORIENTATION=+
MGKDPEIQANKKIKIDELTPFEVPLGAFECEACKAVTFRLVRTAEDVSENIEGFHPEFCHQIFGEEEIVYGYKGLKVNVYLHCVSMQALVDIQFAEKMPPPLRAGMGGGRAPDDIEGLLKEALPSGFTTHRKDFLAILDRLQACPPQLPSQATLLAQGAEGETEWSVASLSLEKSSEMKNLAERLQPLVLFFIDGGSFIDTEDPKWDLHVLLVKDAQGQTSLAGFCTVYRFYGYPESIRLRISQVIVLPPYQRHGHCSRLIESVYSQARMPAGGVLDVTMEEPTDVLRRVRDRVELRGLLANPLFSQAAAAAVTAGATETPPKRAMQVPEQVSHNARSDLKMCKGQLARCWEFLLYREINKQKLGREESGALERMIKQRLTASRRSEENRAKGKCIKKTEEGFVMMKISKMAVGKSETGAEEKEDVYETTAHRLSKEEDSGDAKGEDGEEMTGPTVEDEFKQVMEHLQYLSGWLAA